MHFGLQGGFLPASISRLGAPGQTVPAGRAVSRVSPGGTLRRLFQGRFTINLTGDADDIDLRLGLPNLTQAASPTGGTYSGGGDMDGTTTAPLSTDLLAWLFHMRITSCSTLVSSASADIMTTDAAGSTIHATQPLLLIPAGSALPTEANPWEGFVLAGGNGRSLLPPGTGLVAGTDRIQIAGSNWKNAKGTIDIIMLSLGS